MRNLECFKKLLCFSQRFELSDVHQAEVVLDVATYVVLSTRFEIEVDYAEAVGKLVHRWEHSWR